MTRRPARILIACLTIGAVVLAVVHSQSEIRMYCGDVPNPTYDDAKCEGWPPFHFFVNVIAIGLACAAACIATNKLRH